MNESRVHERCALSSPSDRVEKCTGLEDVDVIGETALGVQALGAIPIKSNRKGAGEINVPVTFGAVTFKPGDFVYADNNGIIVSPESLVLPG